MTQQNKNKKIGHFEIAQESIQDALIPLAQAAEVTAVGQGFVPPATVFNIPSPVKWLKITNVLLNQGMWSVWGSVS